MYTKVKTLIPTALVVGGLLFAKYGFTGDNAIPVNGNLETSTMPIVTIEEPIVEKRVLLFQDDIDAITLTLSGECYEDKLEDKRKVAEVIVNRVSKGTFGDSVTDVVSASGQFHGYYKQSREISESDIDIAIDVLTEWTKNGHEPVSEYLYFCAGTNRENKFRKEF